eukprot:9737427-Alexandrium_andersonii.AAC.1
MGPDSPAAVGKPRGAGKVRRAGSSSELGTSRTPQAAGGEPPEVGPVCLEGGREPRAVALRVPGR